MKTRYKYIHFEECPQNKPVIYYCKNNKSGDFLGQVEWYPTWLCYVFEPWPTESVRNAVVFNSSCLKDIADFMEQLGRPLKSKD